MTRYRIADDVAWVSLEDLDGGTLPSAYVTRVPHGPPTTLEGPSCVVWLALEGGGTAGEVTSAAAELWGVDPDVIAADVTDLLAHLVRVGLAAAE